ncbi:MAG: TadE/TadG family type IV pilus assembly protein [Acidimicrobiales bacterium]
MSTVDENPPPAGRGRGRVRLLRPADRAPERGATAVEFAIVSIPLFMLLFAIMEGGLLMRSHLSVSNAIGEAARRGAVAATDSDADWRILQEFRSRVIVPDGQVARIVVFRADTPDAAPPAACLAGATTSTCNVYTGADLSKTVEQITCDAGVGWCPSERKADAEAPDLIGVWVEADHQFATGMFGAELTFDRTAVRPLERKRAI